MIQRDMSLPVREALGGSAPGRDGRDPNRELKVLTGELERAAQAIIDKYPNPRSATLPLLFLAQAKDGHLTEDGMRDVGQLLDITPAEVLASASFYTMFKKRSQGRYLLSVCRNISCTHMGARDVVEALQQRLGIDPGETTPDGVFTLETAECLGTCDGAPSMQVNYEDFYRMTPSDAVDLVARLSNGEEVRSVRGAKVRTAREISYEIAVTGAYRPKRKPNAAVEVQADRVDSPVESPATEAHTAGGERKGARLVGGVTLPPDLAPGWRPRAQEDGVDEERNDG